MVISMRRKSSLLFILALIIGVGGSGCQRPAPEGKDPETGDLPTREEPEPDCCKPETPASSPKAAETQGPEVVTGNVTVPDVTLINQDGQRVRVYHDLAEGKVLVLNVIFTTCKGICPPMGINFGELRKRLGPRVGRDVSLVSVSIDPLTDTPERLKEWGKQFGATTGWTLLTGQKQDVDRLLKGLGVFTSDKINHTPYVLVGRASEGRWRRVHGLTSADKLADVVLGTLGSPSKGPANVHLTFPPERGKGTGATSAAQRYFTDVPLVDQHGKTMRLYSDVLKGKVVVISPFFTSCRATCPRLIDSFVKLQSHYGDRVGKDLFLATMTVDPETDTPDKLKSYAEQIHARPGWSFLTGEKQNVETALAKLGHRMQRREDHTNIFIIGNERTGLWKKAMGLAPSVEIIRIVDSVLKDNPS